MISINKFIVYTITIIIESKQLKPNKCWKSDKKHDKLSLESLDFVFAERWERRGAYGLPMVCHGPVMSRWLWAPVVAVEASQANGESLKARR